MDRVIYRLPVPDYRNVSPCRDVEERHNVAGAAERDVVVRTTNGVFTTHSLRHQRRVVIDGILHQQTRWLGPVPAVGCYRQCCHAEHHQRRARQRQPWRVLERRRCVLEQTRSEP